MTQPASAHADTALVMPNLEPDSAPLSSSEALELVRDELMGMDPRTLLAMNLDVASCAMLVRGVLKNLRAYRPALVELCGEEKARCIDRLDVLALATLKAHARYRATDASVKVQPIAGELMKVRDVLFTEARALVARDVLDAGVLGELSGAHGHKNLCVDVLQLASVFGAKWDQIESDTGLTKAYVARAENLADRLALLLGERAQAGQSPAADLRQRAFSLLLQTYDDARRLVTYLRWKEGDYDRIAPSLFTKRGRKRAAGDADASDAEAGDATSDGPGALAVHPGMPGAPPFVEQIDTT